MRQRVPNPVHTARHRGTAEALRQVRRRMRGSALRPRKGAPGCSPPAGSDPRPGPPCCCTPPRSCPAPGESACPAARSSSWRRRSRVLHTCRSPSVCRAGTWWRRRGRSTGQDDRGLPRAGCEAGAEPGLGPRGQKGGGAGAGAGAGRDSLARKRGPRDGHRQEGPTPSSKPAWARAATPFRLGLRPSLLERKTQEPLIGAGRWLPDTSFQRAPSSHWLLLLLDPETSWLLA